MRRTMVFVTYDQAEDEIYFMSRKGGREPANLLKLHLDRLQW